MPGDKRNDDQRAHSRASEPDDDTLIKALLDGDASALRPLIQRYDRLVRYTIFHGSRDKCASDPQWLDSVASMTWTGLVKSMRKNGAVAPLRLKAYLVRIARNQTVSALRSARIESVWSGGDVSEIADVTTAGEDPAFELERIEWLAAIRACRSSLEKKDRVLLDQLDPIMERRWSEAAGALGMSESTLRSRWKRVLERLRRCMREKNPDFFAPDVTGVDR